MASNKTNKNEPLPSLNVHPGVQRNDLRGVLKFPSVLAHLCSERLFPGGSDSQNRAAWEFKREFSKLFQVKQFDRTRIGVLLLEYAKRIRGDQCYPNVYSSISKEIDFKCETPEVYHDYFTSTLKTMFLPRDGRLYHDDWIMTTLIITVDLVEAALLEKNVPLALHFARWTIDTLASTSNPYFCVDVSLLKLWITIYHKLVHQERKIQLTVDYNQPVPSTLPVFLNGYYTVLTEGEYADTVHFSRSKTQKKIPIFLADLKHFSNYDVFGSFVIDRLPEEAPTKIKGAFAKKAANPIRHSHRPLGSTMHSLGKKIEETSDYKRLLHAITDHFNNTISQHRPTLLALLINSHILPIASPISYDRLMTAILLTSDLINSLLRSKNADDAQVSYAVDLMCHINNQFFNRRSDAIAINVAWRNMASEREELLNESRKCRIVTDDSILKKSSITLSPTLTTPQRPTAETSMPHRTLKRKADPMLTSISSPKRTTVVTKVTTSSNQTQVSVTVDTPPVLPEMLTPPSTVLADFEHQRAGNLPGTSEETGGGLFGSPDDLIIPLEPPKNLWEESDDEFE